MIEDITHRKVSIHSAYLLILRVTAVIAWPIDVNEIIACASRAFALYYTLRCIVAWVVTRQVGGLRSRPLHLVRFALLTLVCFPLFAFGIGAS